VQPNKAIVGENAFAHEAGIHQDGVLKEKLTYEIMRPEDSAGPPTSSSWANTPAGPPRRALRELGFELDEGELGKAFKRFKDLADKKKEIFDDDLISIVKTRSPGARDRTRSTTAMISGTGIIPRPPVRLKKDTRSSRTRAWATDRWTGAERHRRHHRPQGEAPGLSAARRHLGQGTPSRGVGQGGLRRHVVPGKG